MMQSYHDVITSSLHYDFMLIFSFMFILMFQCTLWPFNKKIFEKNTVIYQIIFPCEAISQINISIDVITLKTQGEYMGLLVCCQGC